MTDVEDPAHLGIQLRRVGEVGIVPVDDMAGGGVETAFAGGHAIWSKSDTPCPSLHLACDSTLEGRWARSTLSSVRRAEGLPSTNDRGGYLSRVSSAFWKRPAWLFSAFASVSNQSAISSKPRRARGLGHARIHVGVFVGLAGDRGFQIGIGGGLRLAGGRIAHFFQIFQMAMGVARLAFRGGSGTRRRRHYGLRRPPFARSRDSGDWPGLSPANASLRFSQVLAFFREGIAGLLG